MSDDDPDDTPAEASTDSEADTLEEWVFGGTRLNRDNKRIHEWIDPNGRELWFKPSGSHAVGSRYEVRVRRAEGGDVQLYKTGRRYLGRCEDEALRDRLWVEHRAAETQLSLIQQERRAKDDDPLNAAIDRLGVLIARTPASQRTAMLGYVFKKLGQY